MMVGDIGPYIGMTVRLGNTLSPSYIAYWYTTS